MNNTFCILFYFLCGLLHSTHGQADSQNNTENTDRIQFVIYSKANNYDLTPDTLQYILPNVTTVFVVHGFLSGMTTDIYATNTTLAYRDIGYNAIFVDWTGYRYSLNYIFLVFQGISEIGAVLAEKILMLRTNGFDLKKVHIVGLSMGAHIAGAAGRYIQQQENSTVHRISGLDPAGPLLQKFLGIFNNPNALRPSDADIVDVSHTNAQALGTNDNLGTIDFYINGGETQPLCDTFNATESVVGNSLVNACSHALATVLYGLTIGNGDYLASSQPDNCQDLVVYGDLFNGNATGMYYLRTETEYPFKSIC